MSQNTPSSVPPPSPGEPHYGAVPHERPSRRRWVALGAVLLAMGVVGFGLTGLLVTIYEHKQETRSPFVRLVEVDEVTTDPVPWGTNWPRQYDSYRRTVDVTQTRYGGSSAMPEQKLDAQPWLRRLYAGYAFSIDYRERRGHAYMLADQERTERIMQKPQSGACLHCHASIIPTYRRLGLAAMGQPADEKTLASDFNWPAVLKGFEIASKMTYTEAHHELGLTPDGTPGKNRPLVPGLGDGGGSGGGGGGGGDGARGGREGNPAGQPPGVANGAANRPFATTREALAHGDMANDAHPVSCIDCHDPRTMQTRVTRPGFIQGIAKLAASDDPVPHLPSIERWRKGSRRTPYDPNTDASRQEMRSFTCGQCHVEYYCATKETLFFPWDNGLKVEQIEKTYDNHRFPDGSRFMDFKHGETGAPIYKAQHPEFETWSQGVHARSGVSCADCHMPYQREGAMKVSSHWVRSPLLNINNACQQCHNVPEAELLGKVAAIQDRTKALIDRSATAMTDMLDAIREAQAAGATEQQLQPIFDLQRKAMWRLDYVSSENSMGFHADQETARILGESIDFSRQAALAALRLRAPAAPAANQPIVPVMGVTPKDQAPAGAPVEPAPAPRSPEPPRAQP